MQQLIAHNDGKKLIVIDGNGRREMTRAELAIKMATGGITPEFKVITIKDQKC